MPAIQEDYKCITVGNPDPAQELWLLHLQREHNAAPQHISSHPSRT